MIPAPNSTKEFLEALYGSAAHGYLVIWQKDGASSFHLVSDLAAATADIQARAQYSDVYYGLGLQPRPLASSQRGTANNVVGLPGLWMDFDIYNLDAPDAHSKKDELPASLEAVLELIRSLPLQPTMLVHTGNGLHGYWLFPGVWELAKSKDREKAKRLSKDWQAFVKSKAKERGWRLDDTSDLARVLRAPGSRNHKNNPPAEVKISEWTGFRYEVADFEAALSASKSGVSSGSGPSPVTGTAAIEPIREGCAWLRHCHDDADSLSENEWYAMLSILGRCEDGEALAHEFSRPYPGYTYKETEKKLKQAIDKAGPRTCRNIRHELDGEPYCSTCPNWGKVRSPIVLGLPQTDLIRRFLYLIKTKQFLEVQSGARYDKEMFADMHMHQFAKNPATILLQNKLLTKAEGLTYAPNDSLFIEEAGKFFINTWRGGGAAPTPGDVTPFLDHVTYLISDELARNHVLDWLAHCVQYPKIRINHALLLQGQQGTGKSFLGVVMGAVLGVANVNFVTTADLNARFNSWIGNRQLIVVEELMAPNRLETANFIKPYLTQDTVMIEEKFRDKYELPNLANFIAFTNHRDAIYLEDSDRRFFVSYSDAVPREKEYYEGLFSWLKDNAGVVTHYLLNRDISRFNPKARPPLTAAKLEMMERSLPPLEAYLKSAIDAAEELTFTRELVTVSEVRNALPHRLQSTSHRAISDALKRFGAVDLGRHRLIWGRLRVYAIRNTALWQQASSDTIVHHLTASTSGGSLDRVA